MAEGKSLNFCLILFNGNESAAGWKWRPCNRWSLLQDSSPFLLPPISHKVISVSNYCNYFTFYLVSILSYCSIMLYCFDTSWKVGFLLQCDKWLEQLHYFIFLLAAVKRWDILGRKWSVIEVDVFWVGNMVFLEASALTGLCPVDFF